MQQSWVWLQEEGARNSWAVQDLISVVSFGSVMSYSRGISVMSCDKTYCKIYHGLVTRDVEGFVLQSQRTQQLFLWLLSPASVVGINSNLGEVLWWNHNVLSHRSNVIITAKYSANTLTIFFYSMSGLMNEPSTTVQCEDWNALTIWDSVDN